LARLSGSRRQDATWTSRRAAECRNSTRAALAAHLDEFAAGEVDKAGYFAMIERVRGRFARSINAGPDEIAFTKNITKA